MTEYNIDEFTLRLECLKLAHHPDALDGQTVTLARNYADFVLGTNDAEIIHAARELTEKVDKGE